MFKSITRLLAAVMLLAGLAIASAAQARDGDFGVLVMAHGGGEKWDGEVEEMLAPVGEDYPLEIAFGMADPASIQDAVERLEARGVDNIAVVRLFVSGESWRERTAQILGLVPGAPTKPAAGAHSGHGDQGGHSMALWRIDSDSHFAMSQDGLMAAPEMNAVLAARAQALSTDPANESILILAHGPGDDAENQRWIAHIEDRAQDVSYLGTFRAVRVETLREDWPEKREESEARVRTFVEQANKNGGKAIVIPYRLSGFGPYAKVLEGLDYTANERGLLPSAEAEQWVRRQAEELRDQLAE